MNLIRPIFEPSIAEPPTSSSNASGVASSSPTRFRSCKVMRSKSPVFSNAGLLALLLWAGLGFSNSVAGQNAGTANGNRMQQPQTQANGSRTIPKRDEVQIPEPENLVLETSDGVRLVCTYFGAGLADETAGHSVVPIILLHDWEGNRGQLLEFGKYLQSMGHAVIVPDLRGHGESVGVIGSEIAIDVAKFRRNEIASALKDIECCKKFLVQKNNDGQLNIDLLSMVAVGKSSLLAAQWSVNDWFAFPPFNAEGIKQGQDIKSLMLVSPEKKLGSASLTGILANELFTGARSGAAMPLLLTWSAGDEDAAKHCEVIFKKLEKARPDVSEITDPIEKFEKTTLFQVPVPNVKLSGVRLLETPTVDRLWPYLESFIAKKVAAKAESFPWKSRAAAVAEDQ